jgi:hypothetical protein
MHGAPRLVQPKAAARSENSENDMRHAAERGSKGTFGPWSQPSVKDTSEHEQ